MSEGHEYWLMQQKERLESELAKTQQKIERLETLLKKVHGKLRNGGIWPIDGLLSQEIDAELRESEGEGKDQ